MCVRECIYAKEPRISFSLLERCYTTNYQEEHLAIMVIGEKEDARPFRTFHVFFTWIEKQCSPFGYQPTTFNLISFDISDVCLLYLHIAKISTTTYKKNNKDPCSINTHKTRLIQITTVTYLSKVFAKKAISLVLLYYYFFLLALIQKMSSKYIVLLMQYL